MSFLKNLVLWLFLIFTLSATNAATRECVLEQVSSHVGRYGRIGFVDNSNPALRITYGAAGNRHITSSSYDNIYYTVTRFSREGIAYRNTGFAGAGNTNYALELPAQFEYQVVAFYAMNTIDGLVFGPTYTKLSLVPMENAQFTGDENEIIKLHQQSTGNELFLTAPIISVTSPNSFQVDVLEGSVKNIDVRVEDIDPQHRADSTRRIACSVNEVMSGDTIRIINNPHDRTLYLEAYSFSHVDRSYTTIVASSSSFGRIYQPTSDPVPTGPSCSRAESEEAWTNGGKGQPSKEFAVYAYGVSSDVTSVFFPTWGDVGGQDDLVWYEGVKQSDGRTWKAIIDFRNHKERGQYEMFNVHVYMNTATAQNQWCGTANFGRYWFY